jgi:hypothetical protein
VIAFCDQELLHRINIDFAAESNGKFVAAECGDQHAGSVRSPTGSTTPATTVVRASAPVWDAASALAGIEG